MDQDEYDTNSNISFASPSVAAQFSPIPRGSVPSENVDCPLGGLSGLFRETDTFESEVRMENRFRYLGEKAMKEYEEETKDPHIFSQASLDHAAIARLLITQAADHTNFGHLASHRAPSMLIMNQLPEANYLVRLNEATRSDILGKVSWDLLGPGDEKLRRRGGAVLVWMDEKGCVGKTRFRKNRSGIADNRNAKWLLRSRHKVTANGRLNRLVWTWESLDERKLGFRYHHGGAVLGQYMFVQAFWNPGVVPSHCISENGKKGHNAQRPRPSVLKQCAESVGKKDVKTALSWVQGAGDIPNFPAVYHIRRRLLDSQAKRIRR